MQITITKIARFTTKKDGTPLTTKDGRPYTSVRLQCQEYGDKWVSGFENADTKAWSEGEKVEAEIEQKGEYLNFRVPKKEDKTAADISLIKTYLADITNELRIIKERVGIKKDVYPTPEDEGINVDDVFPDEMESGSPFN